MPAELVITTTFPEVAARFARAAAEAVPIIERQMVQVGEAVSAVVVPVLADATPRRTGALAASTKGDVSPEGLGVRIDLSQPAVSEDGIAYWIFVDQGRGPVVPVNAKALHWGDVFAMHAAAFPGYHYVEPAVESMTVPITTALEGAGAVIAGEIVRAI